VNVTVAHPWSWNLFKIKEELAIYSKRYSLRSLIVVVVGRTKQNGGSTT
jgi:hypothetical protein